MSESAQILTIGQAAKRSGVPAKTIRYYEEIQLVAPARRGANGYRYYRDEDIRVLDFVRRARSLGFSIKEVQALLALWHDRTRASAEVKALVGGHVTVIEQKISELQSLRGTLVDLMARCHGDDRPECPILDTIADGLSSEE